MVGAVPSRRDLATRVFVPRGACPPTMKAALQLPGETEAANTAFAGSR
jgi:hypothetical protein